MSLFPNAAAAAEKINEIFKKPNPATKYDLSWLMEGAKKQRGGQVPAGTIIGSGMFLTIDDARKFFSKVPLGEYTTGTWTRRGDGWQQTVNGRRRIVEYGSGGPGMGRSYNPWNLLG